MARKKTSQKIRSSDIPKVKVSKKGKITINQIELQKIRAEAMDRTLTPEEIKRYPHLATIYKETGREETDSKLQTHNRNPPPHFRVDGRYDDNDDLQVESSREFLEGMNDEEREFALSENSGLKVCTNCGEFVSKLYRNMCYLCSKSEENAEERHNASGDNLNVDINIIEEFNARRRTDGKTQPTLYYINRKGEKVKTIKDASNNSAFMNSFTYICMNQHCVDRLTEMVAKAYQKNQINNDQYNNIEIRLFEPTEDDENNVDVDNEFVDNDDLDEVIERFYELIGINWKKVKADGKINPNTKCCVFDFEEGLVLFDSIELAKRMNYNQVGFQEKYYMELKTIPQHSKIIVFHSDNHGEMGFSFASNKQELIELFSPVDSNFASYYSKKSSFKDFSDKILNNPHEYGRWDFADGSYIQWDLSNTILMDQKDGKSFWSFPAKSKITFKKDGKEKGYWLSDEEFDPNELDSDEKANPWDHWVGSQTPEEFMEYSETPHNITDETIEQAVAKYIDDCPRIFPEANRQVSRAWLIRQLKEQIKSAFSYMASLEYALNLYTEDLETFELDEEELNQDRKDLACITENFNKNHEYNNFIESLSNCNIGLFLEVLSYVLKYANEKIADHEDIGKFVVIRSHLKEVEKDLKAKNY